MEAYAPLFEQSGRRVPPLIDLSPGSRKGEGLCCRLGWQVDRFRFSIEHFSEQTGILARQAAGVANSLNVLRLRGADSTVLNNYQLREVAKLLASEEGKKRGPLQKHRIRQEYLKWTIYPAMYKRRALQQSGGD